MPLKEHMLLIYWGWQSGKMEGIGAHQSAENPTLKSPTSVLLHCFGT